MQVNAQFARTGMSDDNLHLLDAAIARNGGVVVSFLRGDRFFVVHVPTSDKDLTPVSVSCYRLPDV